mmetsp:Transcript_19632/g.63101  ORF Transcript_19632/g.63101 Transcript_19632/m.63101 type:complete len:359 (+) Transcript_19632:1234-2310(+)
MSARETEETSSPPLNGGPPTLTVGSEEVSTFFDEAYAKVRAAWDLPSDFLSSIDFGRMEAGGGKGGMMMGFTVDQKFIVKELNGADHATMMAIAPEYVAHVLGDSLLARIFGHFERKGHSYLVMNNWMPPPRKPVTNYSQYDLKGCADDKTLTRRGEKVEAVHKRIFDLKLWLGKLFWSAERTTYHEGKVHARQVRFPVSEADYREITAKIDRDVAFLQKYALMDYSLVVSYHVVAKDDKVIDAVFRGSAGDQPYISYSKTSAAILYLGVIDFLQDWNFKKVVAQCIKVAERNKATIPPGPYGDRFANYVKHKFNPVNLECGDGTSAAKGNKKLSDNGRQAPTTPPPSTEEEEQPTSR